MTALGGASITIDDVVWSAIVTSSGSALGLGRARAAGTRGGLGEPIGSRRPSSAVTSPGTVPRPVLEAPLREYSSPLTVDIPATGNLTDDVVRNAVEAPDGVAFSRRRGDDWEDVTAQVVLAEVRAVAKGLVAAGIRTGDRVALISKTRYEWTLVDYAIWFAGAVTVPVYETSSAEQIEWILGNSAATAVVAEGPTHTARIAERRAALESLNHVWSLADNAIEVLRRLGEDISDAVLEVRRTTAT